MDKRKFSQQVIKKNKAANLLRRGTPEYEKLDMEAVVGNALGNYKN
jgi:hypothetical protein